MANMPFVDKLNPDGREYFDFVFNKNKPKYSKWMFFLAVFNIVINSFLIYAIANHQTETNLIKSLIYLNFSYGCLSAILMLLILALGVIGIIATSYDKEQFLAIMKKESFYDDSFIFTCFRFLSITTNIVFLIALATTDHIYLFLFSCFLELLSFICMMIWKTAVTYQFNLLTTEDVNRLVMHETKE